MAEAGWYTDPHDPSLLQYFDGQSWTGTRRPASDAAAREAAQSAQAAQPTSVNPRYVPPTAQATQAAQPQWATPGQPQWATPAQPQWGTPPARPKRRRGPLIATAVVVVAALAVVLGVVLFSGGDDAPSLTYRGEPIANADETLANAERSLASVVKQRNGASSDETRCYFVQSDRPDAGAKKSDIQQSLRCGPVLFVDDKPDGQYVAASVSGTISGNKATLTTAGVEDDVTPARLESDVHLTRPDGKQPPAGNGGLSTPKPPPAAADVLTTATLATSETPKATSAAVMVGLDTRVTITAAGYVTRYGSSDAARRAPDGARLIAFRYLIGMGEHDGVTSAQPTINVGSRKRALPTLTSSDSWVVLAVSSGSRAAIELINGGVTQTLALPGGEPGAGNVQVALRKNTAVDFSRTFTVPVRVTQPRTKPRTITLTARATRAALYYWPPGREAIHASSPDHAILTVRLNYTEPGKSGTFGFDPKLLRLRLPSGQLIAARNISTDATQLYNVYDVPANWTRGIIEITGSERIGAATVSVPTTRSFSITIPAG